MKYLLSVMLLILVAGFLTQCNKVDDTPCAVGALAPAVVEFELVNRMQQDLLDAKTPGHLDTTEIKKLNHGGLIIVPPKYNTVHPGYTSIILPFLADNYQYISLSATDVDTVYTKFNLKQLNACTTGRDLVDVRYNNRDFADSLKKTTNFMVIK